MQEARGEAEQIIAEARKTRESMELRMREETEAERQRRLEETRREIAAETARALEQIRAEVADLTLEATSIVVGKKLDSDRDRELISQAIGSLDFSRLEENNSRRAPHLCRGAVLGGEGRRTARAGARGARRLRGCGRADARAARGPAEPAARACGEGGHPRRPRGRRRAAVQELPARSWRRRAARASSRRSRRSSSA